MNKQRDNVVGAIILIAIGVVALLGQFIDKNSAWDLGLFILPGLGAIFMVWGIVARDAGPMIPGGILGGIGLGTLLIEGPLALTSLKADDGGLFMVAFALGWFSIAVFSALFAKNTQWWALIPGAIMGVIGGGILFGGFFWSVLQFAGRAWPVALIVMGIYLMLRRETAKPKEL